MIINCNYDVRRLVYEGNVAKNKNSIFSGVGYLTAIGEESRFMQDGKFGKLYKLEILDFVDIRESDDIVVGCSTYSVKGVSKRQGGNLILTTVIIEKGV